MVREPAPRIFGRSIQAGQLEDLPVIEDRQEDLVAVDPEVVDAGLRDLRGLPQEPGNAGAGHLEREDLIDDRPDGRRRLEVQRNRQDVAIEHHVEVLVGGDPDHDLVRDRVVRVPAGIPVGDPGGELLEGDVSQTVKRVGRIVVVALLELRHPAALERDRVDVSGDGQVVAQDDRVPALFRRPAPDPVDPCAVAVAEHPVDQAVVRGQVVLGQEADLEGRLGDPGQPRLVGRPGLLVEVAPQAVGDVVVGEPLLGDLGVAVVQAARLGLEFVEERALVVIGRRRGGRREFDGHLGNLGPWRAEGAHTGQPLTDLSGAQA